jgi:hypothetical protein
LWYASTSAGQDQPPEQWPAAAQNGERRDRQSRGRTRELHRRRGGEHDTRGKRRPGNEPAPVGVYGERDGAGSESGGRGLRLDETCEAGKRPRHGHHGRGDHAREGAAREPPADVGGKDREQRDDDEAEPHAADGVAERKRESDEQQVPAWRLVEKDVTPERLTVSQRVEAAEVVPLVEVGIGVEVARVHVRGRRDDERERRELGRERGPHGTRHAREPRDERIHSFGSSDGGSARRGIGSCSKPWSSRTR